MAFDILKNISKVIKTFLLLTLVIIVNSTNNVTENKIYNDNYNRSIDLNTMALKVKEDIENDLYSAKDTFSGDLTAYYANCPLCSGRLACLPNYNVLNGNVNFDDITYGNVRIVASSNNLSCGTIIRFKKSNLSDKDIIAIVLDRGVPGNNIDLLMTDNASLVGRSYITYDILRNGWQ